MKPLSATNITLLRSYLFKQLLRTVAEALRHARAAYSPTGRGLAVMDVGPNCEEERQVRQIKEPRQPPPLDFDVLCNIPTH